MSKTCLSSLNIGGLIAKIPIIQGGMGVGISLAGLAAAVANEGGIGVIATPGIGMNEPDFNDNFIEANTRALKKEIQKARSLSKGLIGVNIMIALTNHVELMKAAIEEGADFIISGAGLPMNLPELLKGSKKTKLIPIVSSDRAARIIIKRWKERFDYLPDAIIVEGPLAGGHLGFKIEDINNKDFTLENLIPQIVKEVKIYEDKYNVKIPVIAAGGIYTGQDILKFMELGASGVQMATRFVTTDECDASIGFKNTYIDADEKDIIIIKSPVGMPGRAINNSFLEAVSRGEKHPFKCPFKCIFTCDINNAPYCIALALLNAQKGNLKSGFAFAGKNAYRATEIISVKKLVETIMEECNNCK